MPRYLSSVDFYLAIIYIEQEKHTSHQYKEARASKEPEDYRVDASPETQTPRNDWNNLSGPPNTAYRKEFFPSKESHTKILQSIISPLRVGKHHKISLYW